MGRAHLCLWRALSAEDAHPQDRHLKGHSEVDLRDTSGQPQFPLRYTLKVHFRDTSGLITLRRPRGFLKDALKMRILCSGLLHSMKRASTDAHKHRQLTTKPEAFTAVFLDGDQLFLVSKQRAVVLRDKMVFTKLYLLSNHPEFVCNLLRF